MIHRRENELLINAITQAQKRAEAARDTAAIDRFRVMRRAAEQKGSDVGAVLRQRWIDAPYLRKYGHPDQPYQWSTYEPEQSRIEDSTMPVVIGAVTTIAVIGVAAYAWLRRDK